ncbi:hypothetical protein HMPREF1982_00485 [Clostridiales bacterium oral taxon 876 str. F0540]|nr:hypothetical protein HMPREF1982_00485 [Clostridiales bacterium oral taxon 876 str. F0540]
MVERKFLDRPNWRRVLRKRFYYTYIEDESFCGYIAAVFIDKTREPLIKNMLGRDFCLAKEGYVWLECLPKGGRYCLTTMINEKQEIVQWYFDIIRESGVNNRGIPYFDDMYLDVVVLPPDNILLLDEDELEEALDNKDITKEDYEMAYNEAKRIMEDIDVEKLTSFSKKYFEIIKSLAK